MSAVSERYCRIDATGFPVNKHVFIGNSELALSEYVGHSTAEVFLSSVGFKTFEEHAAAFWSRVGLVINGAPEAAVSQICIPDVLRDLSRRGWFVSDARWLAAMTTGTGTENSNRLIAKIGIVTKDRPAFARRCIDSVVDSLNGAISEITVYDDSAGTETLETLKDLRKTLKTPTVTMRYASRQQKDRLVSCYTRDAHSKIATEWLEAQGNVITISPLTVFEVSNAHCARVFRRIAPQHETNRALAAFDADRKSGVYREIPLPASVWETAVELALVHTPTLGAGSLDILHVAFALTIHADLFLTFDKVQARLAQVEGLELPFGLS